jgi:hypothetical protein
MPLDMIPERYSIENLCAALRDPSVFLDEGGRIGKWIREVPRRLRFRVNHGAGVKVMERDWDHLIILDACRYDVFAEHADIDGELESVISRGSHSREFCKANFTDGKFHDTVYVTANGYGARICNGVFHDLVFTDETDAVSDVDVLHSTSRGMAPSTVLNAALEANDTNPDKRLVVHFMQLHDPYFGPKAKRLRARLEDEGLVIRARDPEKIRNSDRSDRKVVNSLSAAAKEEYITDEELREVYVDNLRTVLTHVETLLEELSGKVVITADHGEYLGERGKIGHPEGEYTKELRNVP